jgi:hypothetical protein
VAVLDLALAQIPVEHIEDLEILVRADTAGAQLSFTDHDGYRFQAILTDQHDHARADRLLPRAGHALLGRL